MNCVLKSFPIKHKSLVTLRELNQVLFCQDLTLNNPHVRISVMLTGYFQHFEMSALALGRLTRGLGCVFEESRAGQFQRECLSLQTSHDVR